MGPAFADLDDICVAVEMYTIPGSATVPAGDNIPTRIFFAVAGCAKGAHQLGFETRCAQPLIKVFANLAVIVARRGQGGNADQILGQRDQVVAAACDCTHQGALFGHAPTIGETP